MDRKPVWFDSHAHLADAQFDADRDVALSRAVDSGVPYVVEIGEGPDEWEKARQLAESYTEHIWWAVGFHPYFADRWDESLKRRMEGYLSHPRLVGVGEVGLDYAKTAIPKETQIQTLRDLVRLAFQHHRPLIIHCREAYHDLIPLLKTEIPNFEGSGKSAPGVVHCFSGTVEDAGELLNMGFFIGLDGPLTYPNAKRLREALAIVPLERIVLETDSPYLPPQSRRGQRNEPSYIPEIGRYLSSLRGIPEAELADMLTANTFRLFGINRP